MVLNTFTVSAAIAPTIIKTCTSHVSLEVPETQFLQADSPSTLIVNHAVKDLQLTSPMTKVSISFAPSYIMLPSILLKRSKPSLLNGSLHPRGSKSTK